MSLLGGLIGAILAVVAYVGMGDAWRLWLGGAGFTIACFGLGTLIGVPEVLDTVADAVADADSDD